MSVKVTKESLEMRIRYLSDRPLSLNEEYQLEAYRMLLDFLRAEEEVRELQNAYYQDRL